MNRIVAIVFTIFVGCSTSTQDENPFPLGKPLSFALMDSPTSADIDVLWVSENGDFSVASRDHGTFHISKTGVWTSFETPLINNEFENTVKKITGTNNTVILGTQDSNIWEFTGNGFKNIFGFSTAQVGLTALHCTKSSACYVGNDYYGGVASFSPEQSGETEANLQVAWLSTFDGESILVGTAGIAPRVRLYNSSNWDSEDSWIDLGINPSSERGVSTRQPEAWPLGPNHTVLASGTSELNHFQEQNVTTEIIGDSPLHSIWGNEDEWFVVGDGGAAHYFDGQDWTPLETGTDSDLFVVRGQPNGPVIAAGADGTILELVRSSVSVDQNSQ